MKNQWDLNRVRCFFAALAIFLGLPLAAHAAPQVIYVSQGNSNPTRNGNSWVTAYSELYSAMADARVESASASSPVEFWISAGTYKPLYNAHATDPRLATFQLSSHVHFFGGFQGTESSKSQRVAMEDATSLTVLSGDVGIAGFVPVTGSMSFVQLEGISITESDPGYADNCYNVLYGTNVTDVVLDQLVVYGGTATVSTNVLAQPVIEAMSQVEAVADGGNDGSAIFQEQGDTLAAMDHRIAGGGLCFLDASGWFENNSPDLTTTNLTIRGCIFVGNTAAGYGGGVAVTESRVQVDNSYFYQNIGGYEGGAFWGLDQLVNFNQCFFGENTSVRSGGAVHLQMLPSRRTMTPGIAYDDFSFRFGLTIDQALANLQAYQSQVSFDVDLAEAGYELQGNLSGAPTSISALARLGQTAESIGQQVATLFIKKGLGLDMAELVGESAAEGVAFYGAVTAVLLATDLVFQLLNQIPALQNSPTYQAILAGWNMDYNYFNEYVSPISWLEDLAGLFPSDAPAPPTYLQAATPLKQAEYAYMYNAMPESTFLYCAFEQNFSVGTGGALYVNYAPVRVESSLFQNNTADENAGAAAFQVYCKPTLISDAFVGNISHSQSGHSAVVNSDRVDATYLNCSFVTNYSYGQFGYALDGEKGADVMIGNCLFWGNWQWWGTDGNEADGGGGGEAHMGGDIVIFTSSMLNSNALVTYNSAGNSHYEWVGRADIRNSCIQSLFSLPAPVGGDQIQISDFTAFNSADDQGIVEDSGFVNVGEGIRSSLHAADHGNTYANPLIAADSLSLLPGSPAIGAGHNALFNSIHHTVTGADVFGNARTNAGTVDMGAVETSGLNFTPATAAVQAVFDPFDLNLSGPAGFRAAVGGSVTPPDFSFIVQTNLYINASVSGGNGSGTSWANAMKTIPLTTLGQSLPSGGVVWIAAGTYSVTGGPIVLPPGVSLFGGFAGGEGSLSQFSLSGHPTIIKGGGSATNLIIGGGTNTIYVQGLIFTGARGDGGLKLSCPAVVQNCLFTNNSGPGYNAISPFLLTSCQFRGNSPGTVVRAGAVFNAPGNIANCTFSGNSGIAASVNSDVIVANSQFTGNTAAVAGDSALASVGPLTLTGCSFSANAGVAARVNGNGYLTTVLNCQFTNNTARFTSDSFLSAIGEVTVQNCGFSNNFGGCVGYFPPDTTVAMTLTNCQFTGNDCQFTGSNVGTVSTNPVISATGAVALGGCSFAFNAGPLVMKRGFGSSFMVGDTFGVNSLGQNVSGALLNIVDGEIIQNCNFSNNNGPVLSATNCSISDCVFGQNTGYPFSALTVSGGNISSCLFSNNANGAVGAFSPSGARVQFNGCQFSGQGLGVALASSADILNVVNCRFDQNSSSDYAGALIQRGGTVATIVGSEFFQNSGWNGAGAIYATNVQLNVENCTIVSNLLNGSGVLGGAGIRSDGLKGGLVVNSILYGNQLANPFGVSVEHQQFLAPSNFPLAYSLIQGLTTLSGTGCFDAPPDFVGPTNGALQLMLMADSPAINAGVTNYNGLMATPPATDLAGNPRQVGPTLDLGAYEFQGTPDPRINVTISFSQACSDSAPSFFFTVSTNAVNYQWQINRLDGNGYVPVVADAVNSGIGTTRLTVLNPSVDMAGYLYRVVSTGNPVFISPGVFLPAYNTRVYVNATATGNGSGTNWVNAFTSLPAAVKSLTNCGQIWVAAGTYAVGGQTMYPGPDVQMFGGFAGTEASLSQRNWQANPTVIKATGSAAFGFNSAKLVDSGTSIDGFQFTASGAYPTAIISAGAPGFQNCAFLGSAGEAVSIAGGANPAFNNCQFYGYSGDDAVYNNGNATFQFCLFANNTNASSTAPFRNVGGTTTFSDCQFTNNTGSLAGGIYIDSGRVVASRCQFLNNSAYAGAIFNGDGLFIDNSLIAQNHGYLGAVVSQSANTQLTYCTVVNNVGQSGSGGLYQNSSSSLAIFPNDAGFSVQDCIFWGNSVTSADPGSQENQQIFLSTRDTQSGVFNSLVEGSGNLIGRANEVFLYTIAANPLFVNPAAGNYQLTSNSPALNRAFTNIAASPFQVDPAAPQQLNLMSGLYSYDLNNAPRPFPGNLPDLGAYQFQGAAGTPLVLYDLPSSQTICGSEPSATFIVSGGATNTYQWQELVGTNYVDVTNVPQLQVTQFTGPALTNVLTVPTTAQFNGAVFRVSVNNGAYLTPGATLTVNQPGIIYVNAAATSAGDGQGWATAYKSLAQALSSSGGGCAQIWAAAGTYPCDNDPAGPMHLRSTVQIYGGFAGSETNLSQRDFVNNVTRLVPGNVTNYITADSTLQVPADSSAVLDGFQLSNVWLYVNTASPTIRNCTFENIPGYALSGTQTGLTVDGCVFQTNGAGIYLVNAINASVLNSSFIAHNGVTGNSSVIGAILEFHDCQIQISGCNVSGNSVMGPEVVDFDTTVAGITNCQFSFNTNTTASGHTLDFFNSRITLERCAIVKNSGAAMVAFAAAGSTVNLNNSLVADNLNTAGQSGEFGGIIYLSDSTVNALNDTVANNACDGGGSAFALVDSTLNLRNGIVWNNTAPLGVSVSPESAQISVDSGRANVSYSVIQGLSLYRGNSNLPYDPLFVDPANGNYELQSDSPANGVGSTNAIPAGALDLAGISRLRNSQVDLGAYAYPGTPGTPVDLATSFSSQSLCSGDSAVFSVVNATGGMMPVTWQVNLGGGFVNLAGDSQNTITTLSGGGGSQLSVSLPDTTLSGAEYRYILSGLSITSAPAILTVNPRTLVYVDAAAAGTHDGASWSGALTSLGAALQVADSCTAIYVAAGTYPQTSQLELPAGVAIYGGFPRGGAGNRNPTNYPTVITAAGGLSDFLMRVGATAEPGQNTLIDGLQFTNANQAIECDTGTPIIQNCQFKNLPGIAIYFQDVSATLLNCVFHGAPNMPSVQCDLSTLFVSGCVFTNDSVSTAAGSRGAALSLTESQTTVTNCAVYNYNGSAISADQGVVTVYASRFSGNTNANGGAAVFNYTATITLNDCLVDRNSSGGAGGAIYDYVGTTVVNGSTLAYNTANQAGGALSSYSGKDRFFNCIIWGNISVGGYGAADLDFSNGGSHSLAGDIVQSPGLASGSSVVVADPFFNNPSAGNYTLSSRSPAIGAGNTNVPAAGEFDFAGNPRVQNGTVDLGAYESGLTAFPISLSAEPQTITVCSSEPAVYQVAGNVPYTFQWQYNIGGGWINVSAGAFIDGATVAISQSSTASTLTLTGLTTNLTGLLVQAVLVGNAYTTAAAGLTVVPTGIIYVDASVPVGGDGSSWSKAFNSLIDGLSATTVCSPTVWVAQGTYFPTTANIYARDNYPYFNLPAGVSVYGGFPSGGGDWTTRNWTNHPTILTGPPITANYYEYVVSLYQADGVTLDGFTILGAQNLAGINVEFSNPSLTNLTVTNCSNSGLFLYESPAQVANCRFVGNSSPNGGGGAQVIGQGSSNAVFLNCVFQGNTVQSFGGGVYIGEQCSPQFVNVLITGNQSGAGAFAAVSTYGSGGLFVADGASPTLVNSTVAGNTGGIYAENSSQVTLVNSIVWGNRYGSLSLETEQVALQNSGATFDHSTIEGLATYSGTQVTGGDPLFLNPLSVSQAPVVGGDYHLELCSPFLAAGNPSAVSGVSQDLDGQPRLVGGAVEYGPYESGATAATPLLITTQPLPLTYTNGGSGNVFTVAATGGGLSYEWQSGGVSLVGVAGFSGATTPTLSVDQSNPALNGSQIRCQVTSSAGCTTYSTAVLLTVYPSRFYVNAATGNDLNNGLSWSNAFQTVGPAMTAAHDSNSTAVWIAGGNYFTPSNAVPTWQASYRVPQNLTIHGGFAGNETSASQRIAGANPTVIQVPGITARPTDPNSSAIFWLASGSGLDGLTVGSAGVGVFSESVVGNTITNCAFSNCYYGISIQGSTSISVVQSRFQSNYTGFFLNTGVSAVTNCVFTGDTADLEVANGTATALGCLFNGSGVGAGLQSGALTVMNSAFSGKGLGASLSGGNLTIQDSTFTGNGQGVSTSYGTQAALMLERDTFRGNGSTNLAGGGALLLGSYHPATVEDCLFSGNAAQLGGAVYDYEFGSTFRNCTFTGNRNFAIYNDRGAENFVNCILWNNTTANPAGGDWYDIYSFEAVGLRQASYEVSEYAQVYGGGGVNGYNVIQNPAPALYRGNFTGVNYTNDPGFVLPVDPATAPTVSGDFHLVSCSPVIALGNAGATGNSPTDLDGLPRALNGTVTPGAYEPQSSPLTFALQPANAAGSLGQAVSFTAAVTIPAGVTYQWQVGIGGGAYANLAEGAPYSGVTTTTLNLAGTPAYNGNNYRLAATFPGACTVYSQPAAYSYFLAGVNLTDVLDDVLRTPSAAVTLSISGGVNAASANDQSVVLYGMESGRSTLGFTVNGSTLSLNPVNPFHPGELISVTADSNLKTSSGSSVQPYNWQFVNDVNSWSGTFVPPQTLSIAGMTSANTLAVGDLNGDGSLDLFVSTTTGGLILTNDGTGNFAKSGALLGTTAAAKIVLGDTRGLGRLDALLLRNGSLEVWTNSGAGTLGLATNYTQLSVSDIALGDLNNDGYLDLFVVSPNGDQVWFNDGAGHFVDSGIRLADSNSASVALGDFNGDGYLDAVVVGPNSGAVWLNQGGSAFAQGPGGGIYSGYSRVLVADINDDGKLDLVAARDGSGNQGFVDVWSGTGFGNFNFLAENWAAGTGHGALAVGDVNGDHFPDIVYLTTGQNVAVNETATAYYPSPPALGNLGGANATALADLNGDGALDLVMVNPQGNVALAFYQPTQLTGNEETMLTGFGQTFIDAFARISTNTLTTVTIASLPAQGTLYLSGTAVTGGQVVPRSQLSALAYEGVAFYHGRDLFTWQGTDQNGLLSGTLDFNITLLLVPHNVVPADDYIIVGQGESVSTLTNGVASVFANDLNVDGGTLAGGLNTPPAHGTIQFNSDGTFVYTHDGSPTHADSFSYLVTNLTTGDFAEATAHITVTNVNHTPTAIALSSNTIYEGQPAGLVVAQLSAADPDPAHTQFIYTLAPGAGGNDNADFAIVNNTLVTTAPLVAAQSLTRVVRLRVTDEATAYDAGGAFYENYFVINVTPLPVALAQNVNANENAVTGITLTGTSAGAYIYTIVAAPTNGVLSGTPPNLSYTPGANFFGPDYFTFQVSDGVMTSSVAPVSIAVNFVNQAPTVTNENFSTLENLPVNIAFAAAPFLASHTLSYQIVSGPNYGTLSGTPPNLLYTPFTNIYGLDTIIFTASDDGLTSQSGFVNINIQHVNQPPVARSNTFQVQENSAGPVVLSAVDPDFNPVAYRIIVLPTHGTVTIPGSTSVIGFTQNPEIWTYQPNQNYSGPDSFVFVANDGALDSNPATITINVTPLPSPVAVAQTVNPTNAQPFGITLSAFDAKGFTNLGMYYLVATGPTNGQLTTDFAGSSNLTYTPLANFTGRDSFTFTAAEGGFVSAPATVQIVIAPPPPIAYAATYGNFGNSTSVVLQATDPNGLPLTYYIINGPTNGVISSTSFPRIFYTPNLYYWGTDTFTFGVSNSFGGNASNTITFDMIEPDHPINVVDEFLTNVLYAGVPFTLGVGDIASDTLNDPLTIVGVSPGGGSATFTSNSVTYIGGPAGGNSGLFVTVSNRFETATAAIGLMVLPRRISVNLGVPVPPGPLTNYYPISDGSETTLAPDLPSAVAFANSFGPGLEWNIYCGTWPNTTPIVLSSSQTNTPDGTPSALGITANIVIRTEPTPEPNTPTQPLQLSVDPTVTPMRLFQVANGARLRLENCLISDGTAPQGGAIYNEGTLEIVDDSLTDNLAQGDTNGPGLGGAIYNHNGSVAMTNSTLADNTADLAGGIYQFGDGTNASLVVSNCVMSGHGAAYDFYSTNDNGGSSAITAMLLSSANPSQPWFGPLAPAYTVRNSLTVNFPVSYDNFTGGFVITPTNPWNDASTLQIKGDGGTRTLSMSQPETTARTPKAITVTLTNGGLSYAEVFTLTVDPASQSAPVAVDDHAEVVFGFAATIPVLANDENPDGTPLTITGVSNGREGTATISGTNIIYQSLNNSSRIDTFTYQVSNGFGTSTGTVYVQLVGFSDENPNLASSADSGPGTLRAALNLASQFNDPTIWNISLNPGIDNSNIILTSFTNTTYGPAAFVISDDVIIDGGAVPGATLEMATNAAARLFYITSGGSLTLRNLRLTGGTAAPGVYGPGLGGAIYNEGRLILTNVVIDDNTALGTNEFNGLGGGIYNAGTVVMNSTLVTNNTAFDGGGLYQFADGGAVSVVMTNSYLNNPNSSRDLTGFTTNNGTASSELINSVVFNPAPPWVGELPAETVTGSGQIGFYTSPGIAPASLTALSGNSLIVPSANLSITPSGTLELLAVNPVNNGMADILITAVDGGVSFARDFELSVYGSGVINPVVPNSAASVTVGQSVMVPVLTNAVSAVGVPLRVLSVTPPVAGTAVVTNNEIFYVNTGGVPTNEVITFVVTNDFGGSTTATLAIAVVPLHIDLTTTAQFGDGSLFNDLAYIATNQLPGVVWTITVSSTLTNATASRTGNEIDNFGVFGSSSAYTSFMITNNVIIDGSAAPGFTLTVNPNENIGPPMRIFHVVAGASLVLRNIRLSGGQGAGFGTDSYGGAILNEGTLVCENVLFDHNVAIKFGSGAARGGAICNLGLTAKAMITNCTFAANSGSATTVLGGAVYNENGTVILDSNTVSNNVANSGSGVYNYGNGGIATLELARNTFTNTSSTVQLAAAATTNGQSFISSYHDVIPSQSAPWFSIPDQVVSDSVAVNFATPLPVGYSTNYFLNATSANQSVIPNGNLVLSGSVSNGTLTVTPVAGAGDSRVTLTFGNTNFVYAETFDVTIDHLPPVVTTQPATSISGASARLNANVTPGAASVAVYFEYGTTTGYGLYSATNIVAPGAASVPVGIVVSGLPAGTGIHYRAVGVYGSGVVRGGPASFTTATPPIVHTLAASGVTGTSATLNGTVDPKGAATTASFAWGKNSNLRNTNLAACLPAEYASPGVSNTLAGLTPATKYYYAVVASNANGVVVGAIHSFTTGTLPVVSTLAATAVTGTSATLNGAVDPKGLATTASFAWGLDTSLANTNLAACLPAEYALPGVSNTLANLAPATKYYYAVVASNANGVVVGAIHSFTTGTLPVVSTLAATAVTGTSATLNGTVDPKGLATTVSFAWGLGTSLANTNLAACLPAEYASPGVSNTLAGLTPATKYYYAVVASNASGLVVGAIHSFTTGTLPVVSTLAATAVTGTSAMLNGKVDPKGLATTASFAWGLDTSLANTNLAACLPAEYASPGVSNTLAGLTPATKYYYAVVASNASGLVVGAIHSFTTGTLSVVSTLAATAVTGTSAMLNGKVDPKGLATTASFAWGLDTSLANTNLAACLPAEYASPGVSNTLTGLTPGTKYYFAVVASNANGMVTGRILSFTTAGSNDVLRDGKPAGVPVMILGVTGLADGAKQIDLIATPDQTFVIEAADNLTSPAWTAVSTNTATADGQITFIDRQSTNAPGRFYRLRSP